MPTDLPPDYVPQPVNDPPDLKDPTAIPPKGEDSVDGERGVPQPGPGVGVGLPGTGGDVVDPTGLPGSNAPGGPVPAGLPTF